MRRRFFSNRFDYIILYTSTDENIVVPYSLSSFNQIIKSNIYNQIGKITFMGPFSIGGGVFMNCSNLKTIIIPNSIPFIGDYAFSSCDNLTSITIPDGVTSIGVAAFRDCSSLTSITIPDGVTSIEGSAFRDCSSLTSITIPDGVTSIEGSAFRDCGSLTSVTIPDSVTKIGERAFYNCDKLTSIYCKATIPPAFGRYVFNGNGSGRKIYVPYQSLDAYKTATYWSEYAADIIGYDFENDTIV